MAYKLKESFKFALINKKEYLLTTPESLQPMEKEHKLMNKMMGHIKTLAMMCIGLWLFVKVILTNINKVTNETLISQQFEAVKKTTIDYKMSYQTLPVHYFSEFSSAEIKNRMLCQAKKDPVACMDECNDKQKMYNLTDIGLYECYNNLNVPTKLYG